MGSQDEQHQQWSGQFGGLGMKGFAQQGAKELCVVCIVARRGGVGATVLGE